MEHRLTSLAPFTIEDDQRKALKLRVDYLKGQLGIQKQVEMLIGNAAFKGIQEKIRKILDRNIEVLTTATDEALMRQAQGAAQVCKDILDSMKIDINRSSTIEQELALTQSRLDQLQARKEQLT